MRGKQFFIPFILLAAGLVLLSCTVLRAQTWSGDFYLRGGSNFLKPDFADGEISNLRGDAKAKVSYSDGKLSFSLYAEGSYQNRVTEENSIKFTYEQESADVDLSYATSLSKTLDIKAGGTFAYKFSDSDKLEADLFWTRGANRPWNSILSMYIYAPSGEEEDQDMSLSFYDKDSDNLKNAFNLKGSYVHIFEDPLKVLEIKADAMRSMASESAVFDFGNSDEEENPAQKSYRITPYSARTLINGSAAFRNSSLYGVKDLKMETFLKFNLSSDSDLQRAATQEKGQWADSLSYRADYDYLTLSVEPGLRLDYKTDKFEAGGVVSLNGYVNRLNSECQGEYHASPLSSPDVRLLAALGFKYLLNERHSLSFNFDKTITRPSYGNVFRFYKHGSYDEELITGNPYLSPTRDMKVSLGYSFKLKRFSADAVLSNTFRDKMIESTYNNETVDGKQYRVYTWVNAGHSNTASASLALGWNGRQLKANLSAQVNAFDGYSGSGVRTQSSDYKISGKVSYDFKYGFSVQADASWQSDIRRTYLYRTGYVSCNARVSKKFKRLELFVEGNDLLDKEIQTLIYSEDYAEGRVTLGAQYRRIVLAGVNYKF